MENLHQLREVLSASAEGDDDRLKSLSEGNPSILDLVNEEGCSALMYAAANGRESTVRFLLRNQVSVDKVNKYEWTALQQACYYGHLAVVGQLLEKGADINKTNVWGSTPLLAATESGNMSLVKMLLTHGARIDAGEESPTQFPPLMAAAQNGSEGIAAVLLNQKADPNVQLRGSAFTPLMFAALNGHASLVRLLLKHGADKEMQSATGQKAVNIAWAVGREDIVKVLGYSSSDRREKLGSSGSAHTHMVAAPTELDIFTAVRGGDGAVAEIKQLLDRDKSVVNSRNEHGATPLMYASMRNSPAACRLLIVNGADVNAQDAVSRWTAFMQSVHHGQYVVAKMLLENGADVNIQAKDGSTALEIATYSASGGSTQMLQLIAEEKRKKSTDNANVLPPEVVLQKREEGDAEGNFHRWMAAVNDKFESRKSISNPLSQPVNGSSGGGSGHNVGPAGVGDMTTIEEEVLEESTTHQAAPSVMLRSRPTPPPFAVSPSADVIMQRVTDAFKNDSTASSEEPTPTPNSHKVFDLDVASSGSTLRKPMIAKPKLSLLKQTSMEEDRESTKQLALNIPPTPGSGGTPATPTSRDLQTPPTLRGIPTATPFRDMPASPTTRDMPVTPTSRGMPTPPTFRGMPTTPPFRNPATPTSRDMPATPASRGLPGPPTSKGVPGTPTSKGVPGTPTQVGFQMRQDQTGDEADISQRSSRFGPPSRPGLSRDNPVQHVAMPPTAAGQPREPLSVNIQSLLQHRSLPGQQHSGPLKTDLRYRTGFNQSAQQDGPLSLARVGSPGTQSSSVDRRRRGHWKKRMDSVDLPTSVPDALRQLELNQYLEIMEENDVDMEAFATMSSEDLLDIGIEDAEHRLKLLNLILKLNRQQTAEAADDRLVYQESTASRTNGFVII